MAARLLGTFVAGLVAFLVLGFGFLSVTHDAEGGTRHETTASSTWHRTRPARQGQMPYMAKESPLGGIEVEASGAAAIGHVATEIRSELRRRVAAGLQKRTVSLHPDPEGGEPRLTQEAAADVVRALRGAGISAVVGIEGGSDLLHVGILAENGGLFGQTLEAWTMDGVARWSVVKDESLDIGPQDGRSRAYLYTVRFKTGLQLSRDDSIEDALDILGRRVGVEIFNIANSRGWADADEEHRFRKKLDLGYSRDVLVGLGQRRFYPEELRFDDAEYYLTKVVWTANRNDLTTIAKAVAQELAVEDTAPWLRVGLTLGAAIVAILLWLRVDLWLKGHYAFLTKVAFAIFFSVGVLVIWKVPLHG